MSSQLDDILKYTHSVENPRASRIDDTDPNNIYGAIAAPNTLDVSQGWYLFNQTIVTGKTIIKWAEGTADLKTYAWELSPGDGYYKKPAEGGQVTYI